MEFLSHVVAISALAVVLVHQILKLQFVPISFANRYPVPTNIILSIIAAVVAVWQDKHAKPLAWTDWVVLVATISLVAALVYNQVIAKWSDLRATEGPGK